MSYSVTREKAPIYTLGSADVRPFSRNKRGIAGTLIWINFDRHGLLNLVHKMRGKYIANVDDIRSRCCITIHVLLLQNAIYPVFLAVEPRRVRRSLPGWERRRAAPAVVGAASMESRAWSRLSVVQDSAATAVECWIAGFLGCRVLESTAVDC